MKPRLLVLITMLAASAATHAQEPDFDKIQIKATRVAGNIYLLEGEGGNIAASVGEDGIVLVDDEFAPLAAKIGATLKGLGATHKPVRFIINTHYHFDHTGGNLPFANDGATVIAHDNVRARLSTGGPSGTGGSIKVDNKPAEHGALPVITFDHQVSVHLTARTSARCTIRPATPTGTRSSSFPKPTSCTWGDDFVRYGFPFIDVAAGGSVQGMIKACSGDFINADAFIETLYNSLTGQRNAPFIRHN